jgi:hypothetical protein
MKYVAQIRDRRGRLRFQTGPHDTRDQAAKDAFERGPPLARTCSTSEAYQNPSGDWRSNGMDVRWHRRDQFIANTNKKRSSN